MAQRVFNQGEDGGVGVGEGMEGDKLRSFRSLLCTE